jgi:hypothetical protein
LLWEHIYHSASPDQQAELLSLASREGILYAHQLPALANGSRNPTCDPVSSAQSVLAQFLNGEFHVPAPVVGPPLTPHDSALDACQREAVARALGTQDLCLIQGLPGTGKSRVAAEIVLQAARRGDRVLLLAPTTAAVDRILELVAGHDVICPVRCVGADEKPEGLSTAVRAMTYAAKVRALREHTIQSARQGCEEAEQRCARRLKEQAIWPKLVELVEARQALEKQREELRSRRALVPDEVRRRATAAESNSQSEPDQPFHAALAAWRDARKNALAANDAALEAGRVVQIEQGQIADKLAAQVEPLRPLVAAKLSGRWWSPARWRAIFQGDVAGRLSALDTQLQTARTALTNCAEKIQQLFLQRSEVERAAAAERVRLVDSEIEARLTALRDQEEALACEIRLQQQKTEHLCQDLEWPGEQPAWLTMAAAVAARAQWQTQVRQDEERCTFARQWAAYLEEAADQVAARLPGYVNVVAATTAVLPADPHFGDATLSTQTFDLLLLDEADTVTEAEFLKVARRARCWVLVGQPAIHGEALPALPRPAMSKGGRAVVAASSPGSLRADFFQRLWHQLHCDPSRLPFVWAQEGERICCRLRPVTADQRRWVETERVADFPEIELRILALPRLPPALAEVVFPSAMSIHEAKQYLYRELQEFPVQTPGRSLLWVDEGPRLVLRLARTPAIDALPVTLEAGVQEWVGRAAEPAADNRPAAVWHTCRIEFDRTAGWDRTRAEAWIQDHLHIRALGRTAYLEVPHRMAPPLAAVVADLLFDEPFLEFDDQVAACAPVEFISVPSLASPKGQRDRMKGVRFDGRPMPALKASWAASCSGVELDLAAPRQADRLPTELRAGLPGRGYVNYLEAQAVVRRLEALLTESAARRGDLTEVAVLALYPSQVQLIRRMICQSARLKASNVPLIVDLPAALRQREAQVVVLSLTRSHGHRAVSFGDGPQTLTLALTRARQRLILVGDPGTLLRRAQREGALDHLDDAAAARERDIIRRLVCYLEGHGRHPSAFHLVEGSSA